jgi:predicted TPR repeat methyltransferase
MAPQDTSVLLHLGRALTKAGRTDAAAEAFTRYRRLSASASTPMHQAGLIEFLSLPPGEQQARYRAGVERTVAAQPQNVEAQVRLLEILLQDGNREKARRAAQKILDLKPEPRLLAEAGQALLGAGEYSMAEPFLSTVPDLQTELAQARAEAYGTRAGKGPDSRSK